MEKVKFGNNILIIGGKKETREAIFLSILANIAKRSNSNAISFQIFNYSDYSAANLLEPIKDRVNIMNISTTESRIEQIYNMMLVKQKDPNPKNSYVFLFLKNVERCILFNKIDNRSLSKHAAWLLNILKNGPSVNFYVIFEINSLVDFGNIYNFDELVHFQHKILLQMPANNSASIMNRNLAANNIDQTYKKGVNDINIHNRALYYNAKNSDENITKFITYELPDFKKLF